MFNSATFLAELKMTHLNSDHHQRPVWSLCAGAVVGITTPGAVWRKTRQVWIIVQVQTELIIIQLLAQIRAHIVID